MTVTDVNAQKMPSTELVLQVNELFHDIQNEHYDRMHPEIFTAETARWRRVVRKLMKHRKGPVNILDVGSGTGFVPTQFHPFLRKGDCIVCSDISAKMLAVCEHKLRALSPQPHMDFWKLNGQTIAEGERANRRFNIVTMNSVLHHIPDVLIFLRELDAILLPGGFLVIAHEPNRRFANSDTMRKNLELTSKVLHKLSRVRERLFRFLHFRLGRESEAPGSQGHADVLITDLRALEILNQRLIKTGAIAKPLCPDELYAIMDLHDHRSGEKVCPGFGFDIDEVIGRILPEYAIYYFESYNHLAWLSEENWFTRSLDRAWRLIRPNHGATFFVVFKKTG